MNTDDRIHGLELLYHAIDTILRQPNRIKPLSVIINTTFKTALLEQEDLPDVIVPQFPADNKLESLELRYLGQNMSSNAMAVEQLANLTTGPTSGQFSNLRRLVLAGKAFHHKFSLYLGLLGCSEADCTPSFPNLEAMILENVQMQIETIRDLRQLPINLTMRNVYWSNRCIEGLRPGSILKSVNFAGIHVVRPELIWRVQGCVDSSGIMEFGGICYDLIWRLASSEFEAMQLANEHAQYCGEVFERPKYMTIADPDVFAQLSFKAVFALSIGRTYLVQTTRLIYQVTIRIITTLASELRF
jgi:hypothetical protein